MIAPFCCRAKRLPLAHPNAAAHGPMLPRRATGGLKALKQKEPQTELGSEKVRGDWNRDASGSV